MVDGTQTRVCSACYTQKGNVILCKKKVVKRTKKMVLELRFGTGKYGSKRCI